MSPDRFTPVVLAGRMRAVGDALSNSMCSIEVRAVDRGPGRSGGTPAAPSSIVMKIIFATVLIAASVLAGDVVGTLRENLWGGHDVVDPEGRAVLEGRPSLGGGERLRDPDTGRFEFDVRPSLDGESIRDLDTGSDD